MHIKNVIDLLPNYLKNESPNRLEALVASATQKPVSLTYYKTTQPSLFSNLLKDNKAIKSFITVLKKGHQKSLKNPGEINPSQMLILLNQVILINIRFDPCRNNIAVCSANEKSVTNDPVYRQTLSAICSILKKCITEKSVNKGKISLLIYDPTMGFYTSRFKLDTPPTDLNEYYNDDILLFNDNLLKKLSEKKSKGIVFLHGIPGTGKTTYIRHLIEHLDKKVIYIPSNMATQLSEPRFLDFLSCNKNSILVIEDAESIISSRDNSRSNTVSNLLNLSDGLLSDCLNIQIICTFNIPICEVDNAFLRAGRLLGAYEFKPLCIDKATQLIKKHALNKFINDPTPLSDIFSVNLNINNNLNQKMRSIGFAS